MTKKEIIDSIGKPDGSSVIYGGSCDEGTVSRLGGIYYSSCMSWYYGKITIGFNDAGLVNRLGGIGCD